MELNFYPWTLPWRSLQVDLLSWKLFSIDVDGNKLTSMKFVEASTKVHGSFLCRSKWKLPSLSSIAASTNIFRGSFYELSYTLTYLRLRPRISQTFR